MFEIFRSSSQCALKTRTNCFTYVENRKLTSNLFHFSTKSKWFEIQRIYFVQVILSPLEWVKCPFFINKKKMPFCGEFPFTINHKMFSLYGLSYNILNQQQSAGLRQSPSDFFFFLNFIHQLKISKFWYTWSEYRFIFKMLYFHPYQLQVLVPQCV